MDRNMTLPSANHLRNELKSSLEAAVEDAARPIIDELATEVRLQGNFDAEVFFSDLSLPDGVKSVQVLNLLKSLGYNCRTESFKIHELFAGTRHTVSLPSESPAASEKPVIDSTKADLVADVISRVYIAPRSYALESAYTIIATLNEVDGDFAFEEVSECLLRDFGGCSTSMKCAIRIIDTLGLFGDEITRNTL